MYIRVILCNPKTTKLSNKTWCSNGQSIGPTFASCYMGYLEEVIFLDKNSKPLIYTRYMDDIFITHKYFHEIEKIKVYAENNSVLKFKIECSIDDRQQQSFRKPTDPEICLNTNI